MAIDVFYSYSHRDEELRNQLENHLQSLQRGGLIRDWHDRQIGAGSEWKNQIDRNLRSADIVLLLVSSDFLASDYCYDIELKLALERHERGEAVVVPILIRPVDWENTPFARFQALPRDGRAVTLWANRDEAFASIARAIRELATALETRKQLPVSAAKPLAPASADRVFDAAIADRVFVGRATELLAQIRRADSGGLRAYLQLEPESEAEPEDVNSRPISVEFPRGASGELQPLSFTLELNAPGFDPPAQSEQLLLPVHGDSEVCTFLVTPRQSGPLTLSLELHWGEAFRGSRTLRTISEAETAAVAAHMNVVSILVFTVARHDSTTAATAGSTRSEPADPALYAPQPLPSAASSPVPPPPPLLEQPKQSWVPKAVAAMFVVVLMTAAGLHYGLKGRAGKPTVPTETPAITSPAKAVPESKTSHVRLVGVRRVSRADVEITVEYLFQGDAEGREVFADVQPLRADGEPLRAVRTGLGEVHPGKGTTIVRIRRTARLAATTAQLRICLVAKTKNVESGSSRFEPIVCTAFPYKLDWPVTGVRD
jgi:hypothetical protein